ncbi:MAG: aryl-sulfate sulfotransferase [Acidobacteria bacterium]|nr:aryl-sulfate sulfotransferase [Acidobacteriota bacterium]
MNRRILACLVVTALVGLAGFGPALAGDLPASSTADPALSVVPNGPLAGTGTAETTSQTVGLFLNDARAWPGYTLVAPKHYGSTYLLDNQGQVVHSWWGSLYEPGQSVYLLENGHLMRPCSSKGPLSTGGGEGGRIEEYDWDNNLVWQLDFSTAEYMQHHDVKPLPNGNVLMLVVEKRTYAEAIAAGFDPAQLADIQARGYMLPDTVYEVKPTYPSGGTVVWKWHVWDHLIQDNDPTKANYGNVAAHPELIGTDGDGLKLHYFWNHMNAIYYHPGFDQIILSVRGNSEIWVIDHSTTTAQAAGHTGGRSGKGGDLLYRWGNPLTYKAGTAADQKLYQQHDAQWIDTDCPGAGDIICFNNGLGRNYSTIDQFTPPVDAEGNYAYTAGTAWAPSTFTWSYQATPASALYAEAISSAQRLPNGNTLICDGTHGTFLEVTLGGETVWKYVNPVVKTGTLSQGDAIPADPARPDEFMNAVFRVRRYPTDYAGLAGRDLTPQGPLEGITIQETVYFPWLGYLPGITNAGFAFVNTSATDQAWVRLGGFDTAGGSTGTSGYLGLLPASQSAAQGDALLDLAQAVNAFVKAEYSGTGIKGFFLAELFANGTLAGLDGAPALSVTTTDGILPRVRTADGYATQLVLSNPGSTAVSATLTGYTGTASLAGGTHPIPAHGCLYLDAATLFPAVTGAAAAFDGCVRVQATGGLIGTALVRYGSASLSCLNLVPATQAATTLYAAHVTHLPEWYSTEIDLVNPGDSSVTATVSPFLADGSALATPFQVVLGPHQVLTLDDAALGLPLTGSSDGWVKVQATGSDGLLGCLTFGHPTDHRYESMLPLQASGSADLYFPQVASGEVGGVNFFTGVTVVNPTTATVPVTFRVYESDGTANGSTAVVQVPAGSKYVRLLSQIEGIGTLAGQSSGYLRVTATAPVVAFELFGDLSGTFLSAVPGQ